MPAGVHYVNGAGDAGVALTKRTVEVRNVNAARENVVVLTKCTAWGCFRSTFAVLARAGNETHRRGALRSSNPLTGRAGNEMHPHRRDGSPLPYPAAVDVSAEIAERLRELEKLGATVLTLQNNAGANADRALEVLGNEVLPALKGARV